VKEENSRAFKGTVARNLVLRRRRRSLFIVLTPLRSVNGGIHIFAFSLRTLSSVDQEGCECWISRKEGIGLADDQR
jgi:hypothetical protein